MDDTKEIEPQQIPPTLEVAVSEQEKEQFFKCFLTDTSYTQEVKLFGDKIKVKFKTLTVEENSDVLRQINLDVQAGKASNDDSYFIKILTYRLALSLISINEEAFQPEVLKSKFTEDTGKAITYVSKKAEVMETWPIFKLSGFQTAFKLFENKVLKLTSYLSDENFWQAAV